MKPSVATALLATALTLPAAAFADTFNFSALGSGGGFSGSGALTATNEGGGKYLITAISGPGVTGLITPNTFDSNDNLLFPTSTPQLDASGFAFTDFTGFDTYSIDISYLAGAYQAFLVDEGGNAETIPVTFNIAATPEPASLLLLGTAALGLVTAARRRTLPQP